MEDVRIKRETDKDSASYDQTSCSKDESNTELIGFDIDIKVKLESDQSFIDKTEILVKGENGINGNNIKIEPEDQVGLQNFDCIQALKSEIVIKEEIFLESENNNLCENYP